MRIRRLFRSLLVPVSFLTLAGCQAFHQYSPVTVQTVDAETGKPIAQAGVRISYPLTTSAYAPVDSVGTTGPDGTVQLRASRYSDAGITIDVRANGYMEEQKSTVLDSPAASKNDRTGPPMVVQLYAEPRPSIELVLPKNFHGLVKAVVAHQDEAHRPGERKFQFEVPLNGVVMLKGPPMLRRVHPGDVIARTADGTVLPREAKAWEVAFHPLSADEQTWLYVVGSKYEFDDYNREFHRMGAETLPPTAAAKRAGQQREGLHHGTGSGGAGGAGIAPPEPAPAPPTSPPIPSG
jgi:hypothetical protein